MLLWRAVVKSLAFCTLTVAILPSLVAQPVLTNLYTFTGGSDGGQPSGGLVANSSGALFGVTTTGGTGGGGTVFELTPPTTPGNPWTFAVLYSFTYNSADGFDPVGPLVIRPDGSLIGSTIGGGTGGDGTVFQLFPPSVAGGNWTKTILYSFDSNFDGMFPGPVSVRSTAIFGTLQYPGFKQSGYGSAYELMQDLSRTWHKKTLWVFSDQNSGYPTGVLAFDSAGNIYGTSEGTQTYVYPGSVYQLAKPAAGGTWTYNRLYTFSLTGGDGLSPIGGVIFGLNGALYGTTAAGGSTGNGSVFSVAPPAAAGDPWTETVLYSFSGKGDGSFPIGGLVADKTGRLFGAAEYGGPPNSACSTCGTVFVLKPPTTGAWTIGVLHDFQGGTDSQQPLGPVLLGKGGVVYGTTVGATTTGGSVYQIVQ
jgi:uncharacterized repeat protein (TIGR03803 family)